MPNYKYRVIFEDGKIADRDKLEPKHFEKWVEFAKERKLEYYTDEFFNVIIRKNATTGFEDEEIIGFQAHTDMICEKIEGSTHDFSKDPIKLYQDGDFIRANGITHSIE